MSRIALDADWCKAARLLLLAPILAAGCASDSKKSDSGMSAFGSSNAASTSWTEKLAAPFKKDGSTGMDNRQATANDSDQLSLKNKPNKKNPDLIVAVAQMHERAGKLDDAENKYQEALKRNPKHLGALLGYAHLQDRRNKLDDASKWYEKAVAAHPKEAAAHNDLGLCYHRRGMLAESQASLTKAVELAPERKLYRNNLATVLVEQGQIDTALAQLIDAHGPAAGHYNVGYLLAKKGDNARALTHFQQSAALDPTFTAAQQWVVRLSPQIQSETQVAAGAAPVQENLQHVAQRYRLVNPAPAPNVEVSVPAQAAPLPSQAIPNMQTNGWAAPPAAVRYPNQQTTGYSGAAALPPTPDQVR